MLAHGALLRRNGFSVDQVKAILVDFHNAGLPPDEVHMLELVRKFSLDSHAVTQADIQTLLADGFSNDEIVDIAIAAGVRNFYARFFDSLGIQPDEAYKETEPELWAFVMQAGQTPGG